MGNVYTVHFYPRGPLMGTLASDTLFGAVCWAIRILRLADVGDMLGNFGRPPRFAFSSAFPVLWAKDKPVYFYPFPALPKPTHTQVQMWAEKLKKQQSKYRQGKSALVKTQEKAKQLEKISLVSEEVFASIVRDGQGWNELYARVGNGPGWIEQVSGAFVTYEERKRFSHKPLEALWVDSGVQHNQIDRVRGATAEGLLFYEVETVFAAGVGLWAALWVSDPADVQGLIQPALRYLADSGLGANRSVGRGHFDEIVVQAAPLNLPHATGANAFVTLSRYVPNDGEWMPNTEPLRYRLLNLWPKREKKFAHLSPAQSNPIHKRRVRMLAPGAIFPNPDPARVVGRLVPVVDAVPGGWTVYQSGLSLTVRAKVRG